MASDFACALAPVGRRSRAVARKAGSDSPPSYQSLRNASDFRRVLDRGIRRRSGDIVVAGSPGQAGPPRLGLVVSRSCGPAVRRNRIKRRLRAAAESAGLRPGTDYVIIATPQVAEAPFDNLIESLRRAVDEVSAP